MLPILPIPYTDNALPQRENERSENILPKCTVPKSEKELPIATIPYTLIPEPILDKLLILRELPMEEKSRTLRLDPRFVKP